MRKFLVLGLLAVSECVHAQPACPGITLRTSSSADLKPGASSRIRLVRQSDGRYTGYEIADAAPHRLLQVIPDFQTRVTPCGPLEDLRAWTPEASARLADGRYLIVSAAANTVHAALYDGSLNFVSESDTPFDGVVRTVALADLDGDGAPDLLAGLNFNFGKSAAVAVLRGLGGVSFQSPALFGTASLNDVKTLAAGDVDGDGQLDVVATAQVPAGGARFLIFYGNGDGTLQPPVEFGSAWGESAAVIADLNRDGVPDLALTNGGGNTSTIPVVTVSLGKGHRVFADPASWSTLGGVGVAVGDVDGDGNPDLVTSGVTVLFGDGRGAFPRRRDYWNNTSGDVFLADFDRDGKTDIVIGHGNPQLMSGNRVVVLFNRGGGEFSGAPATQLTASDYGIASAVSADFNRDGVPDLAIADLSQIRVLTGSPAGRFTMTFQTAVGLSRLAAGDFNGDGIPDLAAETLGNDSARVLLFLSRGDGSFQAPLPFPIPDRYPEGIVAGDFNGDGKLDLAVLINRSEYPSTDEVLVYSGDGRGGFSTPASYPTGQEAAGIVSADFNRDGRADIAVACRGYYLSADAEVTVLLSAPGGGMSTSSIPLPHAAKSIGVIDIGSVTSLAVGFETGSAVTYPGCCTAMFQGRGDGTFLYPIYLLTPYDGFASADLNRDGIPDDAFWGSVYSIIYLSGDSSILLPNTYHTWLLPDMNGDGVPDIVSVTSGAVFVFLNASPVPPRVTVVSAASFAAGPLAPDSLATIFGRELTNAAVSLRDSAGVARAAQILFASDGQINFVVPAATAAGHAILTVGTATVPVTIATVAPSLFSATSLVRVAGDTYVSFYGTGLRAARDVRVEIQGLAATVLYAGPQGQFPGLDQVNVLLPRELAGTGELAAFLTADGVATNRVTLTLR